MPGLENLGQVAPGIYRGSAPSATGLDSLKKMGIRTVINLRHHHGATEEKECRARGLDYVRIGLPSSDAPSDADVRLFLRVVDRPPRNPAAESIGRALQRLNTRPFVQYVADFAPDLICHTHFLPAGIVARLLAAPERLAAMRQAARRLGRPAAAREVAEELGRLV